MKIDNNDMKIIKENYLGASVVKFDPYTRVLVAIVIDKPPSSGLDALMTLMDRYNNDVIFALHSQDKHGNAVDTKFLSKAGLNTLRMELRC